MKITLKKLRELNACKEGLTYFKRKYKDEVAMDVLAEDLIEDDKFGWIFWATAKIPNFKMTDEQLAYCASKDPWAALQYAECRLTDKQIAYCVSKTPCAALAYAADRLTTKQFDYCQKKCN